MISIMFISALLYLEDPTKLDHQKKEVFCMWTALLMA